MAKGADPDRATGVFKDTGREAARDAAKDTPPDPASTLASTATGAARRRRPLTTAPVVPPGATTVLRLLATSDLHMHLLPWDYYTDKPSRTRGLSLLAGLIAKARAEVPTALLLDNGDFLQGSPIGDFIAETAAFPSGAVHPMIAALNHLAYDAVCIGNHEFSHGLEFLERALSKARFAALSANILTTLGADPASDTHLVAPRALLTRMIDLPGGGQRPLTIGLVGLTPSQVIQWEHEVLAGRISSRGMVEAAAYQLAELRREGADLVVALAHSGLGDPGSALDQENAVMRLAHELDFDAIVAGHTHNTFPSADFGAAERFDPQRGLINGRPTVMPGFYGSHLGVIDLHLAARPGAGWQVVGREVAVRPVFRRSRSGALLANVPEDAAIREIARPAHDQTRRWARRKIGETATPLQSFFALISPSPSVRLVARAQADHVRLALRGSVWEGLPILSAAAPFRTGGRSGPENYTHIPAGPMTLRNIADLYTFPNTIIALWLSGAEVKDWLERAAAQFHTIAPGARDADLINAEMPGFDFDLIEGLEYEIDLSRPAKFDAMGRLIAPGAGRITRLRQGGADLDPASRFVLATNSYRLGGGGGYFVPRSNRVILRGGQPIRSILAAYVSRLGGVAAAGAPNWRFAAMPGTSVSFVTSPLAVAETLPGQTLCALDQLDNGFQRFRLTL